MVMKVIYGEEGRLIMEYTTIMVPAHVSAVDLMLVNLNVEVLFQQPIGGVPGNPPI